MEQNKIQKSDTERKNSSGWEWKEIGETADYEKFFFMSLNWECDTRCQNDNVKDSISFERIFPY